MDQTQKFQLPLGVVNSVDIGRMLRELEALNTFMRSAEVRQPGEAVQLPKTSKLLDEFMEINKKTALKNHDREEVMGYLKHLREQAPTIHMSFSADPSPLFTQRLVSWLRQNIHASVLLQIGLQPTIGAGAVVRTTNKYFDLSLREYFNQKKPLLMAKMREKTPGSTNQTKTPEEMLNTDEVEKTDSQTADNSAQTHEQTTEVNS